VRLISEIKNVANDVIPMIHIRSLLVYKQHLDPMTSRKFLIILTDRNTSTRVAAGTLSKQSRLARSVEQNTKTRQVGLVSVPALAAIIFAAATNRTNIPNKTGSTRHQSC
jgi:hypothetical protein